MKAETVNEAARKLYALQRLKSDLDAVSAMTSFEFRPATFEDEETVAAVRAILTARISWLIADAEHELEAMGVEIKAEV